MRKRLAVIFCMLLMSLCGFVGCGNDPYANMSISVVEGLTDSSVQQLNITQTLEEGNLIYKYDEIDFTIKVTGVDSDVDTRVIVSGWEGYIEKPNVEYLGNGVSQITSKPISEQTTGKFILKVQTVEGGKSIEVCFNIDLKINSFDFKENVLQAVSNDYEICLDNIEGLIKFEPEITTQKGITYSIAVPTRGAQSGEYIISDRVGSSSVIYHVDETFEEYSEYKYAEVVTNKTTGKQYLRVYPYLMTATGAYALDTDGNKIPSSFPKIQKETTGNMEGVFYDCITLRAHSNSGDLSIPDKFIDIEVVPSAGEIVLAMNSSLTEEDIFINKDSSGNYNVVLIDPDYKGGLLTADETSYYTERDLTFYVKDPLENITGSTYLSKYLITAENVMPDTETSGSGSVDILMIGERDNFKISALKAGTYTHTFTLEHEDYPGVFTQEVKVTFKVLSIPFKISVNGNTISSAEGNSYINTVYNTYPRGTYGTKFKVDTNSDFRYFVFYSSDYSDTLSSNLNIRRDGDGASVVLACGEVSDGMITLTSSKDGYDYTYFGAQNSFYLTHSLESIPSEPVTIFIGIMFSMADSSYDKDIVENHFTETLLCYPIHLLFENGLTSIDFDSSSYKINLNNDDYLYEENDFGEVVNYDRGLKLWDLPQGRTYSSCVKSITYDESLIKVYKIYDESIDTTSLYIKYVDHYAVGKTKIIIESYNGLTESVWVENYIPTIYQNNGEVADGETPRMPLAVTVDKYSSGYLYSMSGLDNSNHEAQYVLYSSVDDTNGVYDYDSIDTLFMIINAEQKIKFYDYRIILVDGYEEVIPIDITSQVRVTFNYSNYVSFSNGVIYTKSLVTLDKSQPIIMTISYTGGYEDFDEDDKSIYVSHTITHQIKIYIYEPLEGVEVTSAKAVDLYIDNSLGYYNKDLSEHTIISTFIPNEVKLGAQWNGSSDWGLEWNPVELRYEYEELLNSVIIDSTGNEIKIYSNNSSDYRLIYYRDLFNISVDSSKYECNIHNVISEDLKEWFNENGYTNTAIIDYILRQVFEENIEFVVNVYINQFNKLQNINSVRFTAKYANRIGQLKLDVEDDGVYFEIRKNENGQIVSSTDTVVIEYTIDNADVINKNIALTNYDTLSYYATVVPNATGNSGKIYITPKTEAGVMEITLSPEDNIENVINGEYDYYNQSSVLVQSFRIKVADGSSQYPFEIKDVEDYMQMLDDIANGHYYHYVISRDINMNGFELNNINITDDNNKDKTAFSLSGKHTYVRNNQIITTYNSIYNLEINQVINNLSKDVNIGLFGNLESCVILDNISIKNAYITVTDNTDLDDYIINIGLLAGRVSGATITSCSVSGNIKVIRNNDNMTSLISAGGMFGRIIQGTISGLPGEYVEGIVSTGNNAYVDIELTTGNDILATNSIASKHIIGGLVGLSAGSTIENVQVISNLTSTIKSTIGGLAGVVGYTGVAKTNTIDNAYVLPSIVANLSVTDTTENALNIGGVIGLAEVTDYKLTNTIVNFIDIGDEAYTWQNRTNIYVVAPYAKVAVAGLIGRELIKTSAFKYNYVRSYYERAIDDTYQGNIYVIANNGSVGGLIGENYTGSGITYSYFDGDITASQSLNTGMIIGSIDLTSNYTIEYVYAIGLLNDLVLTENESGEYVNKAVAVTTVNGTSSIFGGISFDDDLVGFGKLGLDIAYLSENASLKAVNTYAVINGNINYCAEGDDIFGVECYDDNGNPITITQKLNVTTANIPTLLYYGFDYKITQGEDADLESYNWFWNSDVNTVKVGDVTIAYPLLLKGTQVMFDLVPNNISVKINERDGLYNISYNNNPQVIMYINRLSTGVTDGTYYELSMNDDNSAFSITLDGAVVSTTYVNINNLKMNDRIEFLENSNESKIKIVGNKVYPISTGVVELTIRSYVAKSIYLTINILVVEGITDYNIIANNSVVTPVTENMLGDEIVTYNTIYIDELTNFNIESINQNSSYIANSNYGFVLEILDASGEDENGTAVANGIIKINDTEYTFDSEIKNNILQFNARDFKITGVKFGRVKIAITPYLILDEMTTTDNSVVYKDTYTSLSGDESLTLDNVYLLDNDISTYSNLQKTYCFEVLARAKSIENNRTEIALDSNNKVSFTTILETANVYFGEEEVNGETKYYVTILENIYIKINNKYSVTLNFEGVKFYHDNSGNYVWDKETIATLLNNEISYTLINIVFSGMEIVKTNIDTASRNNTYKISLSGNITFNRDHYRTNADKYDLNSVAFNVVVIPESNSSLSATTVVRVVPNSISEIFTNFYTTIDSTIEGTGLEDTDAESTFIVPGREGLLKVTLDEEFNNSSYVIITLDKKYSGYVDIQQVAAIFDPTTIDIESGNITTGDILGYRDVISLETIETSTHFGIRLSKLSLNYNDTNYFNNTYYIRVLANTSINASTLDFQISSYTVEDGYEEVQYTKDCSLQIIELPSVEVTIKGENYSVLGRGVQKELEVSYKGLSEDIDINIELTTGELDGEVSDYLYITDDNGKKVFSLDLDYINSGRKYYINQEVLTPAGCEFVIDFSASEIILGVLEESQCYLYIDTVNFEIESINLCGTSDILYLKFGENIKIETVITPREIVVGTENDIETFKESELQELVKLAQYEFAGIKVTQINSDGYKLLTKGQLYLEYRDDSTGVISYTQIVNNHTYKGITISYDHTTVQNGDNSYITYEYYEMTGTEISNDTYISLDVSYYYLNGNLVVGKDAMFVYGEPVEIQVVVEDNSTYDHPTPVEDQAKLLSICSVTGGNFILVNNIELSNWAPQEANFDTLDGNGYTITINSFDLSSVRGNNNADVGLFSVVSENTLLKNITIDISPLLKDEISLINDVALMRASNKSTYSYRNDIIDLGYTSGLNFGIIAGTNNGAITNAKVISTDDSISNERDYLHILTTQGYVDSSLVVSNIGGLVGVNSETGAISNSFIGVNISNSVTTAEGTNYYIKGVANPSKATLDNDDDELENIQIYPFVLAGGNNLGGLACINNGIISNSYVKGLGVYNTFPTVGDSATAGLVTYNNNVITSAFVEGNEIDGYRAVDNTFRIESTGYIGGLVYENNSTIENSYTNVFVQTLSSFMGGFVFVNNEDATIINCYSTAVNRNSLATGQFTGVKQGVIQNFGTFTNCYYLVDTDNGEFANINEDAIAIVSDSAKFDDMGSWNGFAFVAGANNDGIWENKEGYAPRIVSSLTETTSFRRLIDTDTDFENSGIIYTYIYDTYYLGSQENPLIIDKAENFDKYIIDSAYLVNDKNIFGYRDTESGASRYVRIVNNLDFENITTAQEHKGIYLYNVTFAGILDGNGMTLNNLNINTDSTELENFGLFAQVGYENANFKSVVKNINLNVRTYKSNGNRKTGILAGTIVNSSIVNVKIDGGSQTVSGLNMSGALAGLIYTTNNLNVSLIDVTIENVKIEATHGSLGGNISERSEDKSKYFFNSFSIEKEGQQSSTGYSFVSLYDSSVTNLENTNSVSYAGGVAGVILANNYGKDIVYDSSADISIETYRTKQNESTIDNIIVQGDIIISTADNAGGLFGYIGENTLIRNSKFIVSDNQLIKAFNNIGGIVGENHGIIEECTIAYDSATQQEYDDTILSNDRTNGSFNLFDMTEGEPYYVVSIGGIAGYSENGVIIDSYAKVNVVKSLAYIAGGIVGYSNGYNYLGYVYNTGAVLGKYITGGIIGLQVNLYGNESDIRNKVYMDNVVSLTNWNAESDTLSVRDEVTKILFNNTKFMYSKDFGYNNFYIKMPEVGNAPITYTVDTDAGEENSTATEKLSEYRLGHSVYYVGSVVGKALLQQAGNNTICNAAGDAYDVFNNNVILTGNDSIDGLYTNANGVFSSTLGIVSIEGSVESDTRNDDYFKTSFEVDGGDDNKINSLSYRIAYSTELNKYESVLSFANASDYLDKHSYSKIFTTQEYIQQLLGDYYTTDKPGSSTRNIFVSGVDTVTMNRYNVGSVGSYADINANIWDIKEYLPEFANGVTTSIENIGTADELQLAFSNSSLGKTYLITNDITINCNDTERRYIKYYGGIKSLFVGNKDDGSKPTIIINFEDGDSNSTTLATIFNLFTGAVLQDINFVIKVTKASNVPPYVDYENYGLLANTLDGVQITNCNFTITVDNSIEFNASNNVSYKGVNTGILFGAVNNSTITDSTFVINTNGINLNNSLISNFGLFAGSVSGTTFKNCLFTLSDSNITINSASDNLNVGGLVGFIDNSRFSNYEQYVIENYQQINIVDNDSSSTSIKSIGSLFGSAYQLNLSEIKPETNTLSSTISSLNYLPKASLVANQLNIALIAGKSEASKISNVVISSNTSLNINDSNYEASTYALTDNLNIGSIIGYEVQNSQIGKSGVVGSYSAITSNLRAIKLSAGAIVGLSGASSQLINNVFSDNIINITNNNEESIITLTTDSQGNTEQVESYATTYVGGILGYASARVGIDNAVSASTINLNISTGKTGTKLVRASVGGLVGASSGALYLNNFASLGEVNLNKLDYDSSIYDTYMSGVVGYNSGIFVGTNGYSYVELPRGDYKTKTYAIANGVISGVTNVYYAQEFIGNNYNTDINYLSYSMGDLYSQISQYSNIYTLTQVEGLTTCVIGNIQVIVPTSLANGYISRVVDDSANATNNIGKNKFVLYEVTDSDYSTKQYNVITSDLGCQVNAEGNYDGFKGIITTLDSDSILSGRSVEIGKVMIRLINTSTDIKYLVNTNNGVLSNIYLITGDVNNYNNVALVGENNGLITHTMVFGVSKANYTLAHTNNGQIYASVSSTKYLAETSENKLYGLVIENLETGIISDCYSNSFAYTENNDYKTTVYGFASINYGTISHSLYYIPSSMGYDNEFGGLVEGLGADIQDTELITKQENSILNNCFNAETAETILNRNNVWVEENSHAQIRGMKDIEGGIVTRIMITLDGSTEAVEIASITELKNLVTNNSGKYTLSYKYDFYVTEENMPSYKVVRVSKESDLVNYINSLTNGYIPANTIVLITNNFLGDNEEVIKIDATKLSKISLNATSAIIGINTIDKTTNIALDFNTATKDGEIEYGVMEHELFNINNGLIAGIDIKNLEMKKIKSSARFAPIATNNGTIDNVHFVGISVKGVGSSYVAGFVSNNSSTGVINNCGISTLYIYSLTWVNRICSTNEGTITNTDCSTIIYDGDMYYGGV